MHPPILQRSLFGEQATPLGVTPQKTKAPPAARSAFPQLSLTDGFDNSELHAEAVFWHRVLTNQMLRNFQDEKAKRKFMRVVLSEMRLKQGRFSPEILMRDMLLMKNLG